RTRVLILCSRSLFCSTCVNSISWVTCASSYACSGRVACFTCSSRRFWSKGYQLSLAPPEQSDDEAFIELHGMPEPVARASLENAGADIEYEVADGWAGAEWESMHLAARKRGA